MHGLDRLEGGAVRDSRGVHRAGCLLMVSAISIWVLAVLQYDPWRRRRVQAAMPQGMSWHDALLAGEAAAFPGGEKFVAFCMAGDGPAAEFTRVSRATYRLVQHGRVEPDRGAPHRVPPSEELFSDRAQWVAAVSKAGERLRCESLTILWPPTDVLEVELDASGHLVRMSTTADD